VAIHPLWRSYSSRANADRQSQRVAHRQVQPGLLQDHQDRWKRQYEELRQLIQNAIPDLVLGIDHVGSTAVPGLIAKPVIDVDLTVPDVDDEDVYLPQLEAVGFQLIFRDDLAGDPHRQLTFAIPNTNLHVWSPGAVDPQRHQLFRRWLRANPADRERYAMAKVEAAGADGARRYNDVKSAVVYDIYECAFLADPLHGHDPQPRDPARSQHPR